MKNEYLNSSDPELNHRGIEQDFLASDQCAEVHEDDHYSIQAHYEHGQWWIIVGATGDSFSVVDVINQNGETVLGFEPL